MLIRQVRALRDGVRFWYQNHLPRSVQVLVEAQTLASVIRRNTSIGREFAADVRHLR